MKPTWTVVWDSKMDKYVAVEWKGGRTPKTIGGREVVITGYFKNANDATDYALALLGRR